MAKYGNWQRDALTLVERILSGESVDETAFEATGDRAAVGAFKMAQGQSVAVIPFGSADQESFPYFNGTAPVVSSTALAGVFPLMPASFKATNTNKPLAIAVAARLAGYEKGEARLIAISDFLVDANLSEPQQQYVNQFESSMQTESPVIFSWRKNRRVQVKLIRARALTRGPGAPTTPVAKTATIQLLSAKPVANPPSVQFNWKASDPAAFQSYSLTIKDDATRAKVFSRASLLGTSASWQAPPSGKYTWQVSGALQDGSQVNSAAGQFEVEGGSLAWVMLPLLALGAIGGTLWWMNSRKGRKRGDRGAEDDE
jgi:hypothetical protein